jgi:hypothetical protein
MDIQKKRVVGCPGNLLKQNTGLSVPAGLGLSLNLLLAEVFGVNRGANYSLVPGLADILEDQTNADFEDIVPEVCHEKI